MTQTSIRKSVAGAAFAAAALLGWAQFAQAAIVNGEWDPPYNTSFAGLGWNGKASWDVPSACLSLTTTISNNANAACSLSDMKVLSAQIGFYDYGNLADPNDDVLMGTLTWTGLPPQANYPKVTSMTFGGGDLTAVTTKRFDWLQGPTSFANVDDYYFALQFELVNNLPQARLYYGKCEVEYGDDHDRSNDGYHHKSSGEYEKDCDKIGSNNYRLYPAVVAFNVVPEPQTYALILAGLGVIGVTSRRRRRI